MNNYIYKETIDEIIKQIYPVNNGGYPDPFVDLEELNVEIDDLCFELKRIVKAKKIAACKRAVVNLTKWVNDGVMKDGSPIPENKRKYTISRIDKAVNYLKEEGIELDEKVNEVPKEVLDRNQKEFYDTAVDGLMHK